MATIKKISGVASTSSPTSEYRLLVESPDGTLMSTTVGDLPTGSGGLGDAAYRGVDTTPTSGSTNVITSGGVYAVIGDINTILDNINGEVV